MTSFQRFLKTHHSFLKRRCCRSGGSTYLAVTLASSQRFRSRMYRGGSTTNSNFGITGEESTVICLPWRKPQSLSRYTVDRKLAYTRVAEGGVNGTRNRACKECALIIGTTLMGSFSSLQGLGGWKKGKICNWLTSPVLYKCSLRPVVCSILEQNILAHWVHRAAYKLQIMCGSSACLRVVWFFFFLPPDS